MTGRYEQRFATLAARGEGAFVPFLVLGDPDPETSLDLVRALARSGADALELGLPFSDPVADGPVIQAAEVRALAAGAGPERAWQIVSTVRGEFPDLPIGLLVYANLVVHRGVPAFYRAARLAGVDSVLVADAPLLEAAPLRQAAEAEGIAPIHIAPPNASPERLRAIAAASRGYVYVTSRPGVTGADQTLHDDARRVLGLLRQAGSPPPLLGFGVATPDHVRQALALGATGAIAGSALVRLVEHHRHDRVALCSALTEVTRRMKAATFPATPPATDT